jgi:hypothetical protein
MVGEKAADHILGREPLPRSNLAPWENPRWQVSDRWREMARTVAARQEPARSLPNIWTRSGHRR